jgi:hypothetical protein
MVTIFSVIFAFQYDPAKPDSGTVRLLFIGLLVRFVSKSAVQRCPNKITELNCITLISVGGIFQLVMILLLLEGVLLVSSEKRRFFEFEL